MLELALSSVITPDHMLLDIGRTTNESTWTARYREYKADRLPPFTRQAFESMLLTKSSGPAVEAADLVKLYCKFFHMAAQHVREWALSNLDWTDDEALSLAECIEYFIRLKKIDLKSNEICAAGLGAISSALARSNSSVEVLSFTKNPVRDDGAREICKSLPNMSKLKTLWLCTCDIGNVGAIELVTCLAACAGTAALRDLFLFDNNIGNEAAEVFIETLPRCTSLVRLGIGGNRISPPHLHDIQQAWNQVPRGPGSALYLH